MAAEEEEPSRPFLVMGDFVQDITLVNNREDWAKVKSRRRAAYGCGDHGDRIVDGLDLYVRRAGDPDLHPSLCIGATLGVLVCVGSEIDDDMAESFGRDIRLSGTLYTVDGDVMVLLVSFIARHASSDFRSYYLVYDSAEAALFLLPHQLPDCRPLYYTPFPLILKVGEKGGDYSLVLMAERSIIPGSTTDTQPVLLTWSPKPQVVNKKLGLGLDLDKISWIMKKIHAFEHARLFIANVVFLYKGNALWVDLGQGIIFCDCSHLIGGQPSRKGKDLIDGLHFRSRFLPRPFLTDQNFDKPPLPMYRNMGCVGDSIWFVVIEPGKKYPGKTTVNVWTIDLEKGAWETVFRFDMQTIWELDGFRAQRLPKTIPKFPILRQQDDGILYMLLPEHKRGEVSHLVGIDLKSTRLVMNRRLSLPWMERPLVMDPDFFSPRHID